MSTVTTLPSATSATSAARSTAAPIVVRDGIEVPAPGRWVIPAQTLQVHTGAAWRRRRRSDVVEGVLVVGDDIELRLDDVAGEFRFRGRLRSADHLGRWRFRGDMVTGCDGVVETTIDIAYHGVFRSGRAVAWLVVAGTTPRPGRWRSGRTRAPVLSGGLNAVFEGRPEARCAAHSGSTGSIPTGSVSLRSAPREDELARSPRTHEEAGSLGAVTGGGRVGRYAPLSSAAGPRHRAGHRGRARPHSSR